MKRVGERLSRLLEIASAPLGGGDSRGLGALQLESSPMRELRALLELRDGFFAFESALHVLPVESSTLSLGIKEWNSSPGWRDIYGELAAEGIFFAEDIFGGQFFILEDGVWSFEPETGERQKIGSSLEQWADVILRDFSVLTGYPIAHQWQLANGPLPAGTRLVPKIPFSCGGEYSLSNLVALEACKGMRIRGALARQLRDLPEGSKVVFEIGN